MIEYLFLILFGICMLITGMLKSTRQLYPFGISLIVFGISMFFAPFWLAAIISLLILIVLFVFYSSRPNKLQKA